MTMREKIARAAWDKGRELFGAQGIETTPWDEIEGKEHHLLVADAVLDAMRTPTEAMVKRGWGDLDWGEDGTNNGPTPHRVWQAMIDAAKAGT